MAISREQVEHVAHLARLGLSDDETNRLQQQLSQILGHMQMIDRLDTSAIPPTAQVIPLSSVSLPMSISTAGAASRSFIMGSSECPPASSLASSPGSASRSSACAGEDATT